MSNKAVFKAPQTMTFGGVLEDQDGMGTTFDFSGDMSTGEWIDQYLVGINYFTMIYPNAKSYVVSQISVAMSASMANPTSVNVIGEMVLRDDDHHFMGSGEIQVSCLAAIGGSSTGDSLTLANNLSTSQSIALPSGLDLNFSSPILGGFDLQYPQGEAWDIQKVQVLPSLTAGSGSATPGGTASMGNGAGNDATTTNMRSGVLVTYDDAAIKIAQSSWSGGHTAEPVTVDLSSQTGGQNLTSAAVFTTGFHVSYKDQDRKMIFMQIGALNVSCSGTAVTFLPYASFEGSNDTWTDQGAVNLLIVGTYDASAD